MCNALSELGLVIDLYVPEGSRKLSIKELDDLVKRKISKPRNFNIFQFKTIKLFSRFKVISNYFGLRNAIMKRDGDIYFTRTPVILPAIRRVGKKAIFESHSMDFNVFYRILDLRLILCKCKISPGLIFGSNSN